MQIVAEIKQGYYIVSDSYNHIFDMTYFKSSQCEMAKIFDESDIIISLSKKEYEFLKKYLYKDNFSLIKMFMLKVCKYPLVSTAYGVFKVSIFTDLLHTGRMSAASNYTTSASDDVYTTWVSTDGN